MWRFLTGIQAPPQKKAKLSETDARYKKEKRKRKPQKTWKDNRPWLQFTPDGTMICSYCVDAKIPETKTEFVAGCKSARIESVKKHDTSEVHVRAAEVIKSRMKEVGYSVNLNIFCKRSKYYVFKTATNDMFRFFFLVVTLESK